MHIAIITAGGAGMYCGSCMHDNTWARSLMQAGAEVSLIPTYTPIRVDEANASADRIFCGGINVYLNGKYRFWRYLPKRVTSWLDSPSVIRWATRKSISNDAHELGALTLSMLQGEHGPHRQAGEELANFIARELKPDAVIFSNALLVGALNAIKDQFSGPVFCMLQGDDVFLDSLVEDYRGDVMQLLKQKAADFNGFFTHTAFYRDHMARYLDVPVDRFEVLPLGIDFADHTGTPADAAQKAFTVGYFARIAPEKGLLNLAEAFTLLKQQVPSARLKIGGYLGAQHQPYFERVMQLLTPFHADVEHVGSPDTMNEKVEFLRSCDVLSVPTVFLEPKGLYVLEAWANGVPVVQPQHGAFPELLETTGGGLLVPPGNPKQLASALAQLADAETRRTLSLKGWHNVRQHYDAKLMAEKTIATIKQYLATAIQGE